MEAFKVYEAIESERRYQDSGKRDDESHIVQDFPLGSALVAIQYKLDAAIGLWYGGTAPHEDSIKELRKIAAICVQMGEKYGMEKRES